MLVGMGAVCRTCLEIIARGAQFFSLDDNEPDPSSMLLKSKLEACVPELTVDIVKESVICSACVDELCSAYKFKTKCLETEEKIYNYFLNTDLESNSINISSVFQWLSASDVHKKSSSVARKSNSKQNGPNFRKDPRSVAHKGSSESRGSNAHRTPNMAAHRSNSESSGSDIRNPSPTAYRSNSESSGSSVCRNRTPATHRSNSESIGSNIRNPSPAGHTSHSESSESNIRNPSPALYISNSELNECNAHGNPATLKSSMSKSVKPVSSSSVRSYSHHTTSSQVEDSSEIIQIDDDDDDVEIIEESPIICDLTVDVSRNDSSENNSLAPLLEEDDVQIVEDAPNQQEPQQDSCDVPQITMVCSLEGICANVADCVFDEAAVDLNHELKAEDEMFVYEEISDLKELFETKKYEVESSAEDTKPDIESLQTVVNGCNQASDTIISGLSCDYEYFCQFEEQFSGFTMDEFYSNQLIALPECSVVLQPLSRKEVKKWTTRKPYKCDMCDCAFATEIGMSGHAHRIHGKKFRKCKFCKFKTLFPETLMTHMKLQHLRKKYRCHLNNWDGACEFATNHKTSWMIHIMCDHGSEQLICEYRKRYGMQAPYRCGICSYRTSNSSDFEWHLRSHNRHMFVCVECPFGSLTKKKLKKHYLHHHFASDPYICQKCHFLCSDRHRIIRHVLAHTKDTIINTYLEHNYAAL